MLELSDPQKKTVAMAVTALSLTIVLAFIAFVAWGALKLLIFTSSAIIPVVMGFFLSLFFKPYYRWFVKTFHNPTVALILMLLTVLVPVSLIVWVAGAVIIDQVSNLVAQGPELVQHVINWFNSTFPKLNALLRQMNISFDNAGELYTHYGPTALKAGSHALKCVSSLVTILLTMIFFVFFLMTKERKGGEVVEHMPFLKEDTKAFTATQIDTFFDILVSFFQRQTIICLIEGVMYGTGFLLVGLPYGFLIGFSLGVMNLIPFFGSLVCLPIALPLAYFVQGGSLVRMILVLMVWGFGQLMDGYLITPRIQGNKTGLGYAGVIFSFVFWAALLGPLIGMLLAIPLSAFCVVLWRAIKIRYIRPMV